MGGIKIVPSVIAIPEDNIILQKRIAEGKKDLFESMLKDSIRRDQERKSEEAKIKDEKQASSDQTVANHFSTSVLLQSSLSASFSVSEKEQKEKNVTASKNDAVMKKIREAYGY